MPRTGRCLPTRLACAPRVRLLDCVPSTVDRRYSLSGFEREQFASLEDSVPSFALLVHILCSRSSVTIMLSQEKSDRAARSVVRLEILDFLIHRILFVLPSLYPSSGDYFRKGYQIRFMPFFFCKTNGPNITSPTVMRQDRESLAFTSRQSLLRKTQDLSY